MQVFWRWVGLAFLTSLVLFCFVYFVQYNNRKLLEVNGDVLAPEDSLMLLG